MEKEEKILMIYVNHDNKNAEVKNISSEAKIYCFLYRSRFREGKQSRAIFGNREVFALNFKCCFSKQFCVTHTISGKNVLLLEFSSLEIEFRLGNVFIRHALDAFIDVFVFTSQLCVAQCR